MHEYQRVTAAVAEWAQQQEDVIGVAVVGSWARGSARMDSDVDIVVVTSEVPRYAGCGGWIGPALGQTAAIVQTQEWGLLTERRVRLPSGLEVEFGFVPPSWADTDPVDPGTAGVVCGGCEPLHDGLGVIERLIAALE